MYMQVWKDTGFVIGWFGVLFGINSTCNAARKGNSTRLPSCYIFYSLSALLTLLIPNTTPNHPITYTNHIFTSNKKNLKCNKM